MQRNKYPHGLNLCDKGWILYDKYCYVVSFESKISSFDLFLRDLGGF